MIFSASLCDTPVIIEYKRIAIVCALVSADRYSVGACIRNAKAKASVDLPAPGVPAIILTSARLNTIWFASNVLNTVGIGSPPMSGRPTALLNVFIYLQ